MKKPSPEGGVAKRGDILICHVCNLEIAEIVRDINFGEPINAAMFKSKLEREIRDGDPMNCPKCGAGLLVHGFLKLIQEKKYASPILPLPKPS